MENTILKYALKNAFDYNGSVNPKVVLGMTLRDHPESKKNVPEVMKKIDEVIKTVSSMSKEDIESKLKEIAPELLQSKKEKKIEGPLKPLPNAEKGKVKVRIAPSPSGPLHIGHAYGASLNYEYAKMYDGKFIVRVEDTNPENIYTPAYELIPEDGQWLTDNNVSEVIVQSSRLGLYYDNAEKLVQIGKAYVCTCDADQWRELKNDGKACPCRELSAEENNLRYAKMFNEYKEGEAVLRLKTDITHKNPAMRDFPIMRINEHVHPKTGKEQKVWPLMVLSVAIDDHELGITHVLNGKDHADNAKKETIIMEYLGWKAPEYKHWGRINFEGFTLSTSKTRIAIEQNEYTGWDDLRLPTLMALRRRGYQSGAFRKYAIEIGLSLNDKKVTMEEFWKNINSFNRDIIEPNSNRYFFVEEPLKVTIKDAEPKEVEIELHPDFPKRGNRKISTTNEVYVNKTDLERFEEGKLYRLMDYCNFEVKDKEFVYHSESYEEFRNAQNRGMIIHWLPIDDCIQVEVLLPNGEKINGFGETNLVNLKEREIVQFTRYAFCTLDKKEDGKLIFAYLHN